MQRNWIDYVAKTAVLVVALLASFLLGVHYGPPPAPLVYSGLPPVAAVPVVRSEVVALEGQPLVEAPQITPPPETGRVALARTKTLRRDPDAVRRDADAIRRECQEAAAGDWARWQRTTAPYRTALRTKLDALKAFTDPPSASVQCQYEALAGMDDFPLFEVMARENLRHLYDPASLEGFRAGKPVLAARRWLAARGVDLIVVTVPQMTEIYIEHFLDPAPTDGIIAPHMRQTLLELLDGGVEVLDGFRILRPLRESDTEYLSNTSDGHWAPRAMRIMAKRVADRVERYEFGARARYALPIVSTSVGPFLLNDTPGGIDSKWSGWFALTPRQQELSRPAQTTERIQIRTRDDKPPSDDPTSPVMLIGSSFAQLFRDDLTRELNLLPHVLASSQQTTEAFDAFLRQPELLDHTRVVIWVMPEPHLTFRTMPGPIASSAAQP
jgi:hypothetical protein